MLLKQAVSDVNIERSQVARAIAKDMLHCYTDLYRQSGSKMTKRKFNELFTEVAYDVLNVPKITTNFTARDKSRYITVITNKLKVQGYTFFLNNDTNRLAVLMHIKLLCKV